ncbi:N-6 DNA methylase [Mesorhizobium sp. M0895]
MRDGDARKTFDYVVANPPFSDKRWSTGLDPLHDEHDRFKSFGVPPAKQGDYAYLLHIVRSLKSAGKGRLHSAARRSLPRQRRSRTPAQLCAQGIHHPHLQIQRGGGGRSRSRPRL